MPGMSHLLLVIRPRSRPSSSALRCAARSPLTVRHLPSPIMRLAAPRPRSARAAPATRWRTPGAGPARAPGSPAPTPARLSPTHGRQRPRGRAAGARRRAAGRPPGTSYSSSRTAPGTPTRARRRCLAGFTSIPLISSLASRTAACHGVSPSSGGRPSKPERGNGLGKRAGSEVSLR
jgi:hypothetical protein